MRYKAYGGSFIVVGSDTQNMMNTTGLDGTTGGPTTA
jgi:hypothetical protein